MKPQTIEEYRAQRDRGKAIEELRNIEADERTFDEVKEAIIVELMYQAEHRSGLSALYGVEAYYTFSEALEHILGTVEAERLEKEARKRIHALRTQFPM